MIKVLFITVNFGYGGAQKVLQFVANNLDRSKFQVSILNQNKAMAPARPVAEDIKIISYKKHTKKVIRHFADCRDIIKTIKAEQPDVVVAFHTWTNFLGTIACRLCGKKIIFCERQDPSKFTSALYKIMHRVEGRAAGAVFQLEAAKASYPKKIAVKSAVIPNPVSKISNCDDYEYREKLVNIAFAGRFANFEKRQDLAVKAFALAKKSAADIILHFYGDGPDMEKCQKLAEDLGVSDSIIFHGKVTNLTEEYLKADCFLLTSDYEGIPNALAEAMSMGIPAVSTDCSPGGAALLMENNVNGLLVPRNDEKQIAEAIILLYNNKELRQRLGKNAKKITERFSEDIIIGKWNDYIEKVANGKN